MPRVNVRRLLRLLSLLVSVVAVTSIAGSQPCYATDRTTEIHKVDTKSRPDFLNFDIDLSHTARFFDDIDIVDQLTMRELPIGSLRFDYRGFYRPLMHHAHRRFRKFWDKGNRERLEYMTTGEARALRQEQQNAWVDMESGRWWERRWFESLTPEKGGAPAEPYVQVVGQDVELRFGPLTVSNTLKFKLDYFAMLQFDTDPDQKLDPDQLPTKSRASNFSIDLRPSASGRSIGPRLRAKVRPNFSIGLPSGSRWESTLRNLALRGEVEVFLDKVKVIRAECEISLKEARELVVSLDLALVSW